jgi:hypothetical protein
MDNDLNNKKKRKRRKKQKKEYFGPNEEKAVREYIKSNNRFQREHIYKTILEPAFNKLVENIINTYKIYPKKLHYEELHVQLVSYIHEKLKYFKPDKGTKAYSYFGTITRRKGYDICKRETKEIKKVSQYEDTYAFFNDNENYVEMPTFYEDNLTVDFFYEVPIYIRNYIDKYRDNEMIVSAIDKEIGYAMCYILENWEDYFENYGETKRYNKNFIYECIRNITGCDTTQIRNALNTYKKVYFKAKQRKIELEYNPFDLMN